MNKLSIAIIAAASLGVAARGEKLFRRHTLKTLFCTVIAVSMSAPVARASLTWTATADQTSTTTRSMRGIALDDAANNLYTTFLQGSGTAAVRSYGLAGDPPVATVGTTVNVSGFIGTPPASGTQAEAVVVDDRGLVFAAIVKDSSSDNNSKIAVFSPSLASTTLIPLNKLTSGTTSETIGGIDFRLDGTTRQLYVSRFRSNTAYVERYVIGGTDAASTTLTLDTTFNTTGVLNLQAALDVDAKQLRGIDVANDGSIFIASREMGRVYKIGSDLSSLSSVVVSDAMDLALFGGSVYVTRYAGNSSEIAVLDAGDLSAQGIIVPSFARGSDGGYAGIDIDSDGRLYVVDQFYGGTSSNLADRVLVSSPIPEPTSLSLLALGGLTLLRRRRI
jgi:hypothetical protein